MNISSAHGLVASVNKCAYVAAKHGVIGLSKVRTSAAHAGSTGMNTTVNTHCVYSVLVVYTSLHVFVSYFPQGCQVDVYCLAV